MQSASVIIYKDKAYVPTTVQIEAGPYWSVAPVYSANLVVEELTQILEKAIGEGNPRVPTPSRDEVKRRGDAILEATGLKSWKALTKKGASYGIAIHDDRVIIYFPEVDNKGHYLDDPTKTREFQTSTDIRDVAATIISDWNAHKR